MRIKIFLTFFFTVLLSTFFVEASTSTSLNTTTNKNTESYNNCKNSALLKKRESLLPSLKEYVSASESINNQTKSEFKKINWYIDSSYTIHAKEIQNKRDQSMIPVNEKIKNARLIVQNTWKAEDSLCEFYKTKANEVSKKTTKKSRK